MRSLLALLLLVQLGTPGTRSALIADRGLKPSDFPQLKKLLDNVYVFSDLHTLGYMTNDLIVITGDGVLIADGQGSAPVTQKLVDQVKKLTSQPIKVVVICSEHGDHTGGNAAFPSNVTWYAHPFSKNTLKLTERVETVTDKTTLKIGGAEIQILFSGRSHTGGDLEVYLPKEKVAFLSETYSNHIFPSMRTAQPTEWITTLKNVSKLDADFVIPGHGFIEDPALMKKELLDFSKALEYVVSETTRLHKAGLRADAAGKQANWGPYETWTGKERNAPIAIQRVFDELDGKLK